MSTSLTPPWTLLIVTLMASASVAGCLQQDDEQNGNGQDLQETNGPATNETTIPARITINGTALALNPAHEFFCIRDGVDGNIHQIGRDVDGWRFTTDPEDTFAVYWFDSDQEYLEGGTGAGSVPTGAAHAEICNAEGTGPTDYTLTLIHPDHPDA